MSETAESAAPAEAPTDNTPLPVVKIPPPISSPDLATILGLSGSLIFIGGAILMGASNANFVDIPSVLIVVLGTIAATSTSYSVEELKQAGAVVKKSMFRSIIEPTTLAKSLLDLAVVAKKKGVLALTSYEKELAKNKFLDKSMQMLVDGFSAADIEFLLLQETEASKERHKRSAGICRRASEVAPAMGLIGTLVGLVQMLANLQNPESIGPAMAVALLTTFYGAIIGMVVMAPLAVKLEKRSSDEALINALITTAVVSIAKQENPRKLEMLFNSELPPAQRIRYFD